MTDEQSKAVQEVAKTSGQLIDTAQKAGSFISKIVGGASSQIGGMLEDSAKFYRLKNLLRIADKVEAIHAQRRIEGRIIPIPLRNAIPMLDSAALEDDDALQNVWARLIANSTDPGFKEVLHPGYVGIIKQMSSDEAIILNSFLKLNTYPILFTNHLTAEYEQEGRMAIDYFWMMQRHKESYKTIFDMYQNHCETLSLKKSGDSRVYIDNLLRLRIVELGYDFSGKEKENPFFGRRLHSSAESKNTSISVPARDEYMRMTAFGKCFIAACISDASEIAI
jgi:hypothetical protein